MIGMKALAERHEQRVTEGERGRRLVQHYRDVVFARAQRLRDAGAPGWAEDIDNEHEINPYALDVLAYALEQAGRRVD